MTDKPRLTDEAEFKRGVKAAFDWLMIRSANNYHGNPKIQARCDVENSWLTECARDMLEDLSPEDHNEWKKVTDLAKRVNKLEADLRACEAERNRLREAERVAANQAESVLLWLPAKTDCEAILQRALRQLAAAIEGTDDYGNPLEEAKA